MDFNEIKDALSSQSLFEDKSWVLSPEPWPLTEDERDELLKIGKACVEFYHAQERLYKSSLSDKNLLRNNDLKAPWVAEYLNRGKPDELVSHGLNKQINYNKPFIIRPDLLVTDTGYALTEMDAVPGGIGLTAYLNQLYEKGGCSIVEGGDAMISGFYDSIAALTPDLESPMVAVVVSDESAVYRPEFIWLSEKLRDMGKPVYCIHPDQVMPLGKTLCAPIDGNPVRIDIIYRFFELFDLQNVSTSNMILKAVEDGEVVVTPPMKTFQEEKLSLGLFHHHVLEGFWRENLSKQSLRVFNQIVPMTWIIDPVDLPPTAVLYAPYVGGKPITSWNELGYMSQKERNLIIKRSGFHESAWGARSVTYGSDVSKDEWMAAVQEAVDTSSDGVSILQEYRKPKLLEHPVYKDDGSIVKMGGRMRLCPYYFVKDDEVSLLGALATFCPADKKIIHGMSDAAMLPCSLK